MATIDISNLVNTNDTGVFDVLSSAVHAQLVDEFANGRLTGTEYSKVYASTIEATLNQAIQFLLQKDISAGQADLLAAQRNLAIAQEEAVRKEILLTEANTAKVIKETLLLDDQQDLLQAQLAQINAEIVRINLQGDLLVQETLKATQEVILITAKIAEANKQIEILNAQSLNIPKEGVLLDKQAAKTEAETVFTAQRTQTEKAQIMDAIGGVAVAGLVGQQRETYAAQVRGFQHKAEFDLVDALTRVWTVMYSTSPDLIAADNVNKLDSANIGKAVSKYMTTIGITP